MFRIREITYLTMQKTAFLLAYTEKSTTLCFQVLIIILFPESGLKITSCLLGSSLAVDGKDGNGLQLEKIG